MTMHDNACSYMILGLYDELSKNYLSQKKFPDRKKFFIFFLFISVPILISSEKYYFRILSKRNWVYERTKHIKKIANKKKD